MSAAPPLLARGLLYKFRGELPKSLASLGLLCGLVRLTRVEARGVLFVEGRRRVFSYWTLPCKGFQIVYVHFFPFIIDAPRIAKLIDFDGIASSFVFAYRARTEA